MAVNVTHVFTRYPHPYQPYNVNLIERQKKYGIGCSVYSFYDDTQRENKFFRVLFYVLWGITKIPLAISFKRRSTKSFVQSLIFVGKSYPIVNSNPDVIHIHHTQVLTPDYVHFFSILKIPCVVSLRGSDLLINPLMGEVEKANILNALKFAQGIHTVSDDLRLKTIQYGISSDKIFVIKRTPEAIRPISARPSFEARPIVLTAIGRYNWTKGFIFLVQAMRILLDKKFDVFLNIIGDGNNDERAELKYWISLLKLNNHIKLRGFIESSEIDLILEQTHIYVQPSVSEGIPNTLIRAVVNKIQVVASAIGGIPEVVPEGRGILVSPGNPVALAEGIIRIMEDETFRINSIKIPSPVNFDDSIEMKAYDNFYSQAIANFS